MSKIMAGNPGLRFGVIYAPDMELNGKVEKIGIKFGVLMSDGSTSVCNSVQYVGRKIIKTKIGKGNADWIKIQKTWEEGIYKVYSSVVQLGITLFDSPESHFTLVVKPCGAFFGLISGRKLLGKKVPESIKWPDGRIAQDLPTKIDATHFSTDLHIAYFILLAADIVTVPSSGFFLDPGLGYLRVSFAIDESDLKEAFHRLNYAAEAILKYENT